MGGPVAVDRSIQSCRVCMCVCVFIDLLRPVIVLCVPCRTALLKCSTVQRDPAERVRGVSSGSAALLVAFGGPGETINKPPRPSIDEHLSIGTGG